MIAAFKWIHLTEDEGVTILFDIRDVIIRYPGNILLQFARRTERNGSVRQGRCMQRPFYCQISAILHINCGMRYHNIFHISHWTHL